MPRVPGHQLTANCRCKILVVREYESFVLDVEFNSGLIFRKLFEYRYLIK